MMIKIRSYENEDPLKEQHVFCNVIKYSTYGGINPEYADKNKENLMLVVTMKDQEKDEISYLDENACAYIMNDKGKTVDGICGYTKDLPKRLKK